MRVRGEEQGGIYLSLFTLAHKALNNNGNCKVALTLLNILTQLLQFWKDSTKTRNRVLSLIWESFNHLGQFSLYIINNSCNFLHSQQYQMVLHQSISIIGMPNV